MRQSLVQLPAPNIRSLTLKDVQDDLAFQPRLSSTFETVQENATLTDAKAKMDSLRAVNVFVTRNGSQSEAVLGWINNVIIEENATL